MSSNTRSRSVGLALAAGVALSSPVVHAGGKIAIDDTKWLSIGLGARTQYDTVEDAAPSGDEWSSDFSINSVRLYLNGQITKHISFEVNTECFSCSSGGQKISLLDGIAKFSFAPEFNVWAGRMLAPSDRIEMSGPYYDMAYAFSKIGLFTAWPQDQATNDFGVGSAGVYGRDHGVTVWGTTGPDGRFLYAVGVFNGIESAPGFGPNQDDHVLIASRFEYEFLNKEPAPWYYTGNTYYGGAGDIFTVGLAMQYQEDGAGSAASPGDFFGVSVDVLFEKTLSTKGVFTVMGEYKNFDADLTPAALAAPDCYCIFDGDAWTMTVSYLFPDKIAWGQFQPYFRYSAIDPGAAINTNSTDEYEFGVNYVIDGPNAKISLFWQNGDIVTGGANDVDALTVALQFQL
ncbi:MAG: hypothetical protein AB7Q97_19285 [Gammaproteobacteria bacterium]